MSRIFCLLFPHFNPDRTKNNSGISVFFTNNWLKVAIVTVFLLCSLAISPIKVAHAADSSNSDSYQNSKVNQTSNSVGTENLTGGVQSAVLKDGKNSPQPKKSSKSKMKKLRDELNETLPIDQKN